MSKKYYVYFIINPEDRTYIGYTVDFTRRIRQHCGELVGGARYTKRFTGWEYLMIMTCNTWNAVRAMQIEWLCKYPERRKKGLAKYRGKNGKIKALTEICSRVNNENIGIYAKDDIIEQIKELKLPENINIFPLNDLIL
jgi:predicted GIY-YIG superfamily endonuclease